MPGSVALVRLEAGQGSGPLTTAKPPSSNPYTNFFNFALDMVCKVVKFSIISYGLFSVPAPLFDLLREVQRGFYFHISIFFNLPQLSGRQHT